MAGDSVTLSDRGQSALALAVRLHYQVERKSEVYIRTPAV